MKSFELERFKAIILLNHSKSTSFRKGERVHDKSDKKQQKVEGVQPEVDVTFSNFFYPHFLFNWIFDPPYLWGSDKVKVTSIKTHPRGFLCVCYSYITRSKATFCQRGLLVPVYLCVKLNAKIAEHSCFWSFK